jgi:5-methylcytosine-specific restriction endonuclease McrBC regulatory subunit McrC
VFVFPEFVVDAEDITRDQMIIQSVNDSYRFGNVMGFLGCGDERLIIESRFSSQDDDFFFQYLLDRVLDFPNIVDLESDANQDNRLFNFLLFLFPYYLKTAMRKGLFKKYIRHRYNDGNVKGTIDIARHIEKNTPFIGNVAYSQREFSYDNSLMELVRHTIEFIKAKPYGNHLLVKVKDEVKLVIDATPSYEVYDRQKVIDQNKKSAVRHAYFREYLALQRLCLLILRHQKHQIGSGSKQIYGILFDGAWLWEEYVNSLIDDIFYHPMNKGGKGAQRLFGGNIGLIYPDFISRDKETRIIADAKYKPIDNIGNRDYLQVLAYMFRFDAKAGYYLYPESEGSEDLQLWMNRGSTYESNVSPRDDISITKHGLKIPADAPDYSGFVSRMAAYEQEFMKTFSAG